MRSEPKPYRVFKPTYRAADGTMRETSSYHVTFKDHHEIRRRVLAFSDKQMSDELGRKILGLVAALNTDEDPKPELLRFVERMPARVRDKLVRWGVVSQRAAKPMSLSKNPLADHVNAYCASLIRRGRLEEYAEQSRVRISAMTEGCRFYRWLDIDAEQLELWLEARRSDGMKEHTSNHYVTAIKGFCRWMVKTKRATSYPLEALERVTVTDEASPGAFTIEQVRTLLAKTWTGPLRARLNGPQRALIYKFALETAMRAGSIRALRPTHFDFKRDDHGKVVGGIVTVISRPSKKNVRRRMVPMRAGLAADVAQHLTMKAPMGKAFDLTRRTSEMLRADLKAAGLPTVDAEGNRLVFHSFRHTTPTWLSAQGVPLKSVQAITGHRDFSTLANRYTHAGVKEAEAALEQMPDLGLQATGTDDDPCASLALAGSFDDQQCPSLTTDTPVDDSENAIAARAGTCESDSFGYRNRCGALRPVAPAVLGADQTAPVPTADSIKSHAESGRDYSSGCCRGAHHDNHGT